MDALGSFCRILPTWTDFLRLTANRVQSCQVMSPTASYGHQHVELAACLCMCVSKEVKKRKTPSFIGLSQPPSAEPLTSEHIDSWVGVIGSVFGLSVLCPACHCVCEAKQNCAQWEGVKARDVYVCVY